VGSARYAALARVQPGTIQHVGKSDLRTLMFKREAVSCLLGGEMLVRVRHENAFDAAAARCDRRRTPRHIASERLEARPESPSDQCRAGCGKSSVRRHTPPPP